MYLLFFLNWGYKLSTVRQILSDSNKTLEDFEDFLKDKQKPKGLEYAYSKLGGIVNKPSYDVVYNRVKVFIQPFVDNIVKDGVWEVHPVTGQGYWRYF